MVQASFRNRSGSNMSNKILIVDDDPEECRRLACLLEGLGYQSAVAQSGKDALDMLSGSHGYSVILLDLVMPDLDGMTVLQRIAAGSTNPPPVVVQVTENGADAANSALRAGATNFLVKPASVERVRATIAIALRIARLEREIARAGRTRTGTMTLRDIATGSPSMERAVRLAERAARHALPVLIEGEPGVGKEQIARAIHQAGPRRARPFVVAEGSASVRNGRLKDWLTESRRGTLYIHSVGTLCDGDQRLLRDHIDDSGAEKSARTSVGGPGARIIGASDHRLIDLVSSGQFREDLFYRLNVLPIWLPPLRERRDDIPELASRCLAQFAAEQGKARVRDITPEAMQRLFDYPWPGNDVEFENRLYRAIAFADGGQLDSGALERIGLVPHTRNCGNEVSPNVSNQERRPQLAVREATVPALSAIADRRRPTYGNHQLLNEHGEIRKLESLEAEAIRFAIRHYQGRMSEVARRLGIGRSTLYRKLREYDLDTERSTAA